ncbi:ISAs1 family transposase [Spirosoma endbachense]|uniref:ISAs1 family transposase n=1 Tax=Spirosoma endbachense TaxID=2666025 RepID=A0A6P1WAZ5_9BACT|nr:ISAs1 family transposase [Spirosoma endbachense]QHW01061.1 ISAs1 family transposase [Spirosoma endbachense]
MTPVPSTAKTTAFFQLLNQTAELDSRDNRGKKHTMALVLSGLTCALCCGRDGSLSSLHRHMVNHFTVLCQATSSTQPTAISRAQLPLVLAKVNLGVFAKLLFEWFAIDLPALAGCWLAVDGKDLRGSIQTGQTRGQACVSVVAQTTEAVIGQAYYSGKKESEKLVVRQLLADRGLNNQQLSLDALHLNPLTVNAIHKASGRYVIGLKANQAQLYRACICRCLVDTPIYEYTSSLERKHGRLEQRSYRCFALSKAVFAPRWRVAGFQTLIWVKRSRQALGGDKLTEDISYYLSNAPVQESTDGANLCAAIRGHWRVETMHYRRDVVLCEDSVRTNKPGVSRLLSSLRTLTMNLLHRLKPKNMAAQLDNFADEFSSLIQFMQVEAVL